ncbi:hypothetical protein SAMN05421858_3054 [Haladaptatus litoreus]|uniref:Uncharacterized protein n=1 Tax=Haladaptatus litoreus TaxID=553468 RepID=A0A1N7CJP9_9EURY|nr:hypothetical protein [Haladaptatus litoreus]SIR63851.1 hypothetical protein SAMN05421858_3054 [Haladaptatus litoreus]
MTDQTITTAAVGRTSAPPDEVDLQFEAHAVDPDVTLLDPVSLVGMYG